MKARSLTGVLDFRSSPVRSSVRFAALPQVFDFAAMDEGNGPGRMKSLVTGSGLIGSEAVELFVFVFLSTNKVYGDTPNEIPLKELEAVRLRTDAGVTETCRIDQTPHSLFDASKAAADLIVGIFRGGCLTGPSHSGVGQHGFLLYLVKLALSW